MGGPGTTKGAAFPKKFTRKINFTHVTVILIPTVQLCPIPYAQFPKNRFSRVLTLQSSQTTGQ